MGSVPVRTAVSGFVQLIVLGAGLALIVYLKTNYAHDVGDWIFSLFGA